MSLTQAKSEQELVILRVLFITPYVPNSLRTRPLHFLKVLAPHHEITLLTPVFSQEEANEASQLSSSIPGLKIQSVPLSKWQARLNCLSALSQGWPMQARYCYSPAFVETARRLAGSGDFDLVHIEHLRASYVGQELTRLEVPVVFDSVDCISLLVERTLRHGPLKNKMLSRVELGATRRYERRLMSEGGLNQVYATSQEDAEALEQLGQVRPETVQVVPNGVDVNFFLPPPSDLLREPRSVIFSGKMSYHANATAARYLAKHIWPLVRREEQQAQLWIVGSQPPKDLQNLSGKHGIQVTGYVPDLPAYLRRASLAVAPMIYKVGIQNKVLEAMACATPVITNPEVAEPIVGQAGLEVGRANPHQPARFAAAIVELLQDRAKARGLGEAGRALVVREYTWERAARRLEERWAEATSTRLYSTAGQS